MTRRLVNPVTITPTKPALRGLTFDLTDDEEISGGVGGWEVLDRPRRTPVLGWTGTPTRTLTIPLVVSGIDAAGVGVHTAVDGYCQIIESWGKPHRLTQEPPVLMVAGLARVPTSDRWVIQGITWGTYLMGPAAGTNGHRSTRRVYQEFSLQLERYTAPSLTPGPAARARQRTKATKATKSTKKSKK